MDSILFLILLFQTIFTSFVGYQYYIYTLECKKFRKNYYNITAFVVGSSVGLPFLTSTYTYITHRLPRRFKTYINHVVDNAVLCKNDLQHPTEDLLQEVTELKQLISDLQTKITPTELPIN